MKVYFDKENFLKFILETGKSNKGRDALRLIKNNIDIHFNFKIQELTEEESILTEEFQDGISEETIISFGPDKILSRPLSETSFPSRSGIYLLADENISYIKNLNTVLIGTVGEEVETLNRLILDRDYSFHMIKHIGKDILPTKHLDLLKLPFNTLIIIDRYIFKGPETGGNIGLIEFNIDKILKNIYLDKCDISNIIFIYQINTLVPRTNPKYDEGPDCDKLTKGFKSTVRKKCPKPNIIFIGVQSGCINDEHDRHIISEYLKIKSGDSLVFFSSTGQLKTNSLEVDYYSLGRREYRKAKTLLMQKMHTVISESLQHFPKYSRIPPEIEVKSVLSIFNSVD